jgi:integrase
VALRSIHFVPLESIGGTGRSEWHSVLLSTKITHHQLFADSGSMVSDFITSEIAGIKGVDVDMERMVFKVVGKGGRYREVPLPADLVDKLNTSKQYLFTPSRSWKSAFYQAVARAARALEIDLTGVHRLRSNFAQNMYEDLREEGLSEDEARDETSQQMGHNRREVTKFYVP